jgi:NDP-sugar pyrophosphorylase family protein
LKAVISAAGESSRMHPLTYTRPKVMLPIANKSILEHILIEAKESWYQLVYLHCRLL